MPVAPMAVLPCAARSLARLLIGRTGWPRLLKVFASRNSKVHPHLTSFYPVSPSMRPGLAGTGTGNAGRRLGLGLEVPAEGRDW
eukprot:5732055-Prymnesium_polylepis.1